MDCHRKIGINLLELLSKFQSLSPFSRRVCFRNFAFLSGLLMVVSSLAGCGGSLQGSPERIFSQTDELDEIRLNYGEKRIAEYQSSEGARKAQIRNEIVLGRLYAIDIAYNEFERKLTLERQEIPFAATTASIALSATGALIADNATKSILAAIDTGLKGTKEAYDKEILVTKTIDFIQQTMRSNRFKVKSKIFVQLGKSAFQYPLELSLSDIEEYYSAGTITSGLIGISAQTAMNLEKTEIKSLETLNDAQARLSPVSEPPNAPSALNKDEARLIPSQIAQIQKALCFENADGAWGPQTRAKVVEFYSGGGQEHPEIATFGLTGTQIDKLLEASQLYPECGKGKSHDSAFKLGTLVF